MDDVPNILQGCAVHFRYFSLQALKSIKTAVAMWCQTHDVQPSQRAFFSFETLLSREVLWLLMCQAAFFHLKPIADGKSIYRWSSQRTQLPFRSGIFQPRLMIPLWVTLFRVAMGRLRGNRAAGLCPKAWRSAKCCCHFEGRTPGKSPWDCPEFLWQIDNEYTLWLWLTVCHGKSPF